MTLYFAYGSNMHRAAMMARCPGARALGPARLDGCEFFIGLDGWASVRRAPGKTVHGVLWRLTPRDMAALHAYELLHKEVYVVSHLPLRVGPRMVRAMVYLLRRARTGRPKPGYAEMCAAAARDWRLPERHVRVIARWSISRWTGSRWMARGEA
ncbi:gamma-glutamylcyclotransferase family protein [Undibacter mobilis]|uniref:Gamma-glutamylcyclotransferase n=1 Tax=Undibacter mobilis TaxID=2292256 RepID=A0A371BCY6_9BRAD|nr:gamma-glutamylcyclotransferase family protein [Undibacter mobilis]RDV05469.1 gamma-glutamylcyclotransferase [Undibacter mobilis]